MQHLIQQEYSKECVWQVEWVEIQLKYKTLKVLKVVAEKNLLVVKGAVPGHKNAYVTIQK